ncbi:MAG: GHKL domain-containing protein [Labilithrix sp.]|nr:GHKL domain-containing protein [Labilithrix sp.]
MSDDALRRKIARQQQQIDLLETMIEDRSRDIFTVNEELRLTNERLERSVVELREMQQALVDASRRAGMADVATSVLHNVGNVLNSVNVSASVVANLTRGSKGAGLPKAVALLRSQPDPGKFLTHDPRGMKLIDYIDGVAGALETERARALDELGALERNIEHIKAIVTMQQSHARGGGVIERLSVRATVEDAIRFNDASFTRHTIRVLRDFDGLGTADEIDLDRHKLFQILMNLLANASQAVKELASERRLTVRARRVEHDLTIEVADNGVGIPAENLTKIFGYGFTTKSDGHGFGLHSSACAAVEMGGRLEARSDGPGRGATFTLAVPCATRAEAAA